MDNIVCEILSLRREIADLSIEIKNREVRIVDLLNATSDETKWVLE